jgi:hypothetical protein
VTEQPSADGPEAGKKPVAIAICCLVIIIALVGGVGLASNLVVRHVVQTLPLWVAVVLGFRRAPVTGWMALPFFLFWFLLMAVIWLYLLGITHLISGHFSPVEIAMTIVVGVASLTGIGFFVASKSHVPATRAAMVFVIMLLFQCLCFRISLLSAIASR